MKNTNSVYIGRHDTKIVVRFQSGQNILADRVLKLMISNRLFNVINGCKPVFLCVALPKWVYLNVSGIFNGKCSDNDDDIGRYFSYNDTFILRMSMCGLSLDCYCRLFLMQRRIPAVINGLIIYLLVLLGCYFVRCQLIY